MGIEKSEVKSEARSEVIGDLAAGGGSSDARIEVVLCERDGESTIALQLSTWHETLGWQRQKTIPFSADRIGQLQRLLCRTRSRMEERKQAVGAEAQVIEFTQRGWESQALPPATQSALHPAADDEMKSAIN